MPYDVVAHAKALDAASAAICKLAEHLGHERFAKLYRESDSLEDIGLAIELTVNSYVSEKRLFTLNVLQFPHKSATVTTADPVATRVINRIGRNLPLPADKIVQPLVASDEKAFEEFGLIWSYLPDSEIHDLAWESFHGWHGTAGYMDGQIAVRPLVTPVSAPGALAEIIQEIRMCYAFGQMIAIHGLCRALLETALTDVCIRIGKLSQAEADSDFFFRDFPPWKRIKWVLRGAACNDAFSLYAATSRVIHGAAKPEDTRSVIRETIDLVERLYAQHAHALSSK
jgi:hypothetical protein